MLFRSHSVFELRGGGGSGAVDSGNLGTMGSSGGIIEFLREEADLPASAPLIVGAGGAAVSAAVAANGNNGSASSFLGAVAAGGGNGWSGNITAVPGVNNLNGIPGKSYSGFPVGNQIRMQSPHGLGYFGYGGAGGQAGVVAGVAGGPGLIIETRFFK